VPGYETPKADDINPSLRLSELLLLDLFRHRLNRTTLRALVSDLKMISRERKSKDKAFENQLKVKAMKQSQKQQDALVALNNYLPPDHKLSIEQANEGSELPQLELSLEQYQVFRKYLKGDAQETTFKGDVKMLMKILKRMVKRVVR
jgi:hypothetical protein